MPPTRDAPALLIYDGVCGFCNASVQWLLKRDRHDRFRFAAQQSAFAEEILRRHGIDPAQMRADNSVYLVANLGTSDEQVLLRSDVTVQCLFSLGAGWQVLGSVLRAIPKSLRDAVYTLIAKNRYKWAGRYESCPIPAPAQRAKFLGT